MRDLRISKIVFLLSRILLLVFVFDVYFTKTDMSIYLLKYEIRNGFVDNYRWPIVAVFILVILLIEAFCNYFIVTGKVKLRYDIRILRPKEKKYSIYMTNLMRLLSILISVGALIGFVIVGFKTVFPPANKTEWKNEKLIGHSFGEIDGETYTGSLEAFEKKYQEGLRTFEVDLARTSDGYLVLRHDWEVNLQDFGEKGHVATLDEFKNTRILGKYTPMSLEDLFEIMMQHKDVWIVTDSKNQNPETARKDFNDIVSLAKIGGYEECLDRIVVQFYNEDMYKAIRDIYEFKGYIFTLYMRWDDSIEQYRELVKWCATNDIHIITMWSNLAENIDVITYAQMYDIDIYVHTVNDVSEARERMYDGVKGVYTDTITPEMLK